MRRRTVRQPQRRPMNVGRPMQTEPPKSTSGERYIPDVRPFMRQYGYTEGLEEILSEIDRLRMGGNFYYEQGDLWRKKP